MTRRVLLVVFGRSATALDLAADALLGSFFTRFYEHGRPGPQWPEQVVDELYPGLTDRAGFEPAMEL